MNYYGIPINFKPRVKTSLDDWAWAIYVHLPDLGDLERKDIKLRLKKLQDNELDIVKTLVNDGWSGTFEELINAAKELS